MIFVPAWGWFMKKTTMIINNNDNNNNDDFRPRVGMGWFGVKMKIFIKIIRFSSPLGDGLVLQILTEILKNQVIRYRHNKQL